MTDTAMSSMFHIVLFEPEIPPNTGNIIRLCANTASQLHLIHPLGFSLEDKQLLRAGLDYHEWTTLLQYPHFSDFLAQQKPRRLFFYSTKGSARYDEIAYQPGDFLLFGPETRGLPNEMLEQSPRENILRIPMQAGNRSLNLSNAVAVVVYEAWRQQNFV
jgi:tRNA (cytidine/uridine-2'-O-)-methyltransferase